MSVKNLLLRLNEELADFEDVQQYIADHFHYTPSRFSNGLGDAPVLSEAGQNEGSCRLFALAKIEKLSQEETLQLFGRHYRNVKSHPEGSDHANIRRFMRDGWQGIQFEEMPLQKRNM